MVKIDAKIRKNPNAKEEMLHLVGKTPSCTDKTIVEWPLVFQKELFMYAELFPLYRELEKEVNVEDCDLINVLPNFVGYRKSLENSANIDENSVLLMENLKVKGFYTADKRTGMDVHHARKALTSLARYHALGIAMKEKRPSFAKKAINQAGILGIDFAQLDNAYTSTCEILMKIPRLKKYSAIIESSFEKAKDGGSWKVNPIEPWVTITHGDFWTNNMLFHMDDNGKVDDVKFVDFQTYIYNSPVKDLVRLLGSSVDVEAQSCHLEELLSLYYKAFVKSLKRMDCDISPFTRESFDREVKRQAFSEFPVSVISQKFFLSEILDDNKSNEENINNIVNDKPSAAFIDKMLWLVEVYERMKWF
ncbi:uncharacterized protein LOC131664583 isoform X2 [Phymastichus coffea]|nr:uncharacterized protein LOC131664583 isoform X2 [Phymastichus coffea]XP_058791782.1 uncharacterized protein LOC131664583 isoform X2 [Phymastichus coffea]XP_058791783.1 uncharacterized protein LOC131664583 isoform X2 [Phymastichus coffea]